MAARCEFIAILNPNLSRVAELFSSPGVWNSALLHELFPPNTVTNILALPVSSYGYQDRWIWSKDKKGSMDNSILGFLLTDLKESLRLAANARVIYVKREANRVAHSLSQFALYSLSASFMPVGPPLVEELISVECNDP
ncbi:hypothetical protein ACLB2K_026711 [Fragaria x ananassa]